MVWQSVAVVIDFLVDVFTVRWKTADKDLEILLLRRSCNGTFQGRKLL